MSTCERERLLGYHHEKKDGSALSELMSFNLVFYFFFNCKKK